MVIDTFGGLSVVFFDKLKAIRNISKASLHPFTPAKYQAFQMIERQSVEKA